METGPQRAGNAPRPARAAGQVLALLLVLALPGVLLATRAARLRRASAQEPAGARWVDPAAARVTAAPRWTDPRWLEHLEKVLASQAPFPVAAEAGSALAALRAELAGLSFVERVERCALSEPGGLELALTLRQPVACIPARGEFALVDEDGVVLEGRWPLPPRLGLAYLPVIGPLDDPLFERARAGDWLVEAEHLDALDVALSLVEHLSQEERAGLGRIVIDARTARRASLEEPGVRLELEGARLALFGRAPGADEPGELAAAAKWRGLARAFELCARDPVGGDWGLVDLRWDRPDLALRNAPVVAALERPARAAAELHEPASVPREPASRPREPVSLPRERGGRDESRPRVR